MIKQPHNKKAETLKLEREMMNCYGTLNYYTNQWLRFRYTDGIKMFCEKAGGGAYWLLDIVNSLFSEKRYAKRMADDFISIVLKVEDNSTGRIAFKDGEGPFYTQDIPFTDCPAGEWRFYYDNNVLMWNGEY